MEYKEHCKGRWIMLTGGLFWCSVIPITYYLAFDQLMLQSMGAIIFVSVAMCTLMFAAIALLIMGVNGLIVNGKTNLILNDDVLQLIVNSGKYKGKIYNISYTDIKKFYFVSDGTKKDKLTDKYYVRENSSGTINFDVGCDYFCVSIYNAMSAAQYVLDRLKQEQIDARRNELDKEGNYQPKN